MRTIKAQMRRSEHSLMPAHMRLLSMCARRTWNLGELAEAQAVSAPTMSKTVNALVERGWLARTPSVEDRRVVHIGLTPTGEQVLSETHRQSEALIAELLVTLSPAERDTLLAGLAILRKTFEAAIVSEYAEEKR
jgi:DNA-binding MarR family transcriptional regulator